LIRSAELGRFSTDIPRWKKLRLDIHEQVCQKGFDAESNSFVQYYGSKYLDASLLMMPLVGFLPADDPRVKGTVKAIETHLVSNGLSNGVHRIPPWTGYLMAKERFWPAPFGWRTTTVARSA
jgi:GH15 family glucan-1,4-alpha-glucosidase